MYNFDYPASLAGVNMFIFGVLDLFADTLNAMLSFPILSVFCCSMLLGVIFCFCREIFKTSRKM